MTARRPGDAWGAAPLSRMNEPAPAIPATRRQTVDTRAGFRVKAAKSRNCTLNPCFPAIITGLRGSFSNGCDSRVLNGFGGTRPGEAFPVGQTLGQTASFRQTAPETWCQSRVCGVPPPPYGPGPSHLSLLSYLMCDSA